ncbi:thioredoxin family protein [Calderihabitans maritimus]|uniref:Thioredoxin n=1 Tax=Calderihabitans maritimus TaxID=1246530 RepID=A0A1Z5HTE2_9FIRM|nr:thioredoxin family protein [Calderihabitans maritimus]GAW92617.1 thioredoxin [Calderihabitans maritimus]
MKIRVLGAGCKNCAQLEQNVFNAAAELGIDADIQKIEDVAEIMKYGVMSTPALVINGKVVAAGRVLNTEEIKRLLTKQ